MRIEEKFQFCIWVKENQKNCKGGEVKKRTMPYEIKKRGNEWVVINKKTGKVKGRHKTKEKALRQLRALYANVKE